MQMIVFARDCPLPRRPLCNYFWVAGHATEKYPNLILKWEACVWQRTTNIINSETCLNGEGADPTINVVTWGGVRTEFDNSNVVLGNIYKVGPSVSKFHVVQQKDFPRDVVEMFKNMIALSTLEVVQKPTL